MNKRKRVTGHKITKQRGRKRKKNKNKKVFMKRNKIKGGNIERDSETKTVDIKKTNEPEEKN